MKRSILILSCFVVSLLSISSSHAIVILHDDFNDGVLGSEWNVSLSNAKNFDYAENGSSLDVTDITPDDTYVWSTVSLDQSFTGVSEFDLDYNFSWDSEGSTNAMQFVGIKLKDDSDNRVASAMMYDAWVDSTGSILAGVGSTSYYEGYDSQNYAANVEVDITRRDDIIDIYWNGDKIMSETNSTLVTGVELHFNYYSYPTSIFGTGSVDLVHLETPEKQLSQFNSSVSVPEPSSIILLGLGLVGLQLSFRKANRKLSV